MRLQRKKSLVTAAAVAVAVGFTFVGLTPANASTDPVSPSPTDTLSRQAAAADEQGYIILGQDDGTQTAGGVFYPTGDISPDTLIVIADDDGSLPDGLTEAKLESLVAAKRAEPEARSSVGTAGPVTPLSTTIYSWSAFSSGYSSPFTGGSVWGTSDSLRVGYSFATVAGYNQRASGQGLGFYRGYNGSQFGVWEKWYYIGTTGSSYVTSTVPWGNVAATKKFMAICTQTVSCWGDWY